MSTTNTTEMMEHMRRAALQIARSFEVAQTLPRLEQAAAMRETSAALIEMRRTADYLAQRLR